MKMEMEKLRGNVVLLNLGYIAAKSKKTEVSHRVR